MPLNQITLIGNLTRDPEFKYLGSGTALAETSIAVNERRKQQDGSYIDQPMFVDIKCWQKTADVLQQYTHKGSQVCIVGRLQQDQWTDKTTGAKRSKHYVVVDRLVLIGSKGENGSERRQADGESQAQRPGEYNPDVAPAGDDIPF